MPLKEAEDINDGKARVGMTKCLSFIGLWIHHILFRHMHDTLREWYFYALLFKCDLYFP